MLRVLLRGILVLSLVVSVAAIATAFAVLGFRDATAWVVVAAALAVMTSVVSSWAAQTVLELQQDAQKPYPFPSADITSRYGLVQLCVRNYGGSAAYEISIKWDKPLLNCKGEPVRFTDQAGAPEIPVLLPSESVSVLIDRSTQLFKKYQDLNYTGQVEFKNASGRRMAHPFLLSIEKHRKTLYFTQDDTKTHHELQRIPDELEKVCSELREIRNSMQTGEAEGERSITP